MLAQSQQLSALEPRNRGQQGINIKHIIITNSLYSLLFQHPKTSEASSVREFHRIAQVSQFENPNFRTQKPLFKKRYQQNDEGKQNGKVSLPSLPTIKKVDLSDEKINRVQRQDNSMQVVNYGNGLRIPSRLPKLEMKSDVPRQKNEENGPHYQSVTPERRQQTPDRQLSLNKKRLMAKSCCLGQYAFKTKPGCLPNKTAKTNQDAGIVFPNNLDHLGFCLMAVSDGHGVNGHLVSNYIKNHLPKHIEQQLIREDSVVIALQKAFDKTNREIWDADIETSLSGSTTVSVLIKKEQIWTANVGDSRAIICRNQDGWKAIQITRDHKPSDEDEKQRVITAGGRIESQRGNTIILQLDFYGNAIGPERVWLQYIDAPGLAMTRSLGDKIGAQAGVIADPEIFEFTLTPYDQCLIVASDGVWEYLSNEDVMNVVVPYIEKENIDLAADRLMAESINAWKRHSLSRDDITCLVVYLKQ